jgi:ssDNA-binding protein
VTEATKTDNLRVRLDNVRLSFPSLYKATAMKPEDKPAFKCAGLFAPDHPAVEILTKAMKKAAGQKWGEKAPAMYAALEKSNKLCLHDGALKPEYDGYEGNFFVNASAQRKPTIKDRDPKAPEPTEASGKIYSGCYVNLVLDIYAQDNTYGKRINASLVGVQFVGDGAAFAGGAPASEDDFATFDGEAAPADDFFG